MFWYFVFARKQVFEFSKMISKVLVENDSNIRISVACRASEITNNTSSALKTDSLFSSG